MPEAGHDTASVGSSREASGVSVVRVLGDSDFGIARNDAPHEARTLVAQRLAEALDADDLAVILQVLDGDALPFPSPMSILVPPSQERPASIAAFATASFDVPLEAAGGRSLADLFLSGWQRILRERGAQEIETVVVSLLDFSLHGARSAAIDSAPLLASSARIGIGAGSAELNLGALLGLLESKDFLGEIELVSLADGRAISARVTPQPIRRLLRQRQFADAALIATGPLRRNLQILDDWQSRSRAPWLIDGVDLPPITTELEFFDQAAADSGQATLAARAWLEERYTSLGGEIPVGDSIGKVRGKDWLLEEQPEPAQEFLSEFEFLIDRAANESGHRAKPLLQRDLHPLRAEESRVREGDPRLSLVSGDDLVPFWATPSGQVLVVLCVGINPDIPGILKAIELHRRQAIAAATGMSAQEQEILGSKHGVEHTVTVALIGSAESFERLPSLSVAEPAPLRVVTFETSDPHDVEASRAALVTGRPELVAEWTAGEYAVDGLLFLVSTGRQEMQVGGMLGSLDLAETAGARMAVGSLQRRGPAAETEVRIDELAVALFPESRLRHLRAALAHLDELEFAMAEVELASLNMPADSERSTRLFGKLAEIRGDLRRLETSLTGFLKDRPQGEKFLAVAQRLDLVVNTLEVEELPANAAIGRAYVAVEQVLGSGDSAWHATWLRDLKTMRNRSPLNHGTVTPSVDSALLVLKAARDRALSEAGDLGFAGAVEELTVRASGVRAEMRRLIDEAEVVDE